MLSFILPLILKSKNFAIGVIGVILFLFILGFVNNYFEAQNACYAECAGYTAADFVNCNPNTGSGFDQLGTCFTVVYPIQVQFQGAVYTIFSDNELLTFLNAPGGATVVYPIQINAIAQPITLTVASEQGLLDVTAQICN
jgi:hypothetical protein